MAKKKKRSRSRRGSASFSSVQKLLTPVAIAAVTEPFVDQLAAQLPIPAIAGLQSDDLVKVALGYFVGKKGGMIGSTAKMYAVFGMRNIVKQLIGGAIGGSASSNTGVLY
jgi:hypothetical protein